MSLHWGGFRARTAFRPEPLVCARCRNDEFLEFTSIDSLPGNPRAVVEATFRCQRCGSVRTQPAEVTEVARILNRPGNTPNVLAFGGHYIHCGQPMASAGAEMRSIHGTYSGRSLPESLGVYLATRVLRCECGFQMEIPDQPRNEGLDDGGPDGCGDGEGTGRGLAG